METVSAELTAILAPVYRRRGLRQNARLYLRGLLMPQVAGNCWSIAEAVGLALPYRLHHLLERAAWDEDAASDAVRFFLTRHLGADGGSRLVKRINSARRSSWVAPAGHRRRSRSPRSPARASASRRVWAPSFSNAAAT
jgi:hypothetical protein